MILISTPLYAWGYKGHQIICDGAWKLVKSGTKKQIRILLKDTKYKTYADSCTWLDAVRSIPRYKFTQPHHYINVKRGSKFIRLEEDCPKEGCIIEAIQAYVRILKGKPQSGYLNNRAKALMSLSHLVGDLHQPLHVSYEDDLGGNKRFLEFASSPLSLHYIWDAKLPEFAFKGPWRKAGGQLVKQVNAATLAQWQKKDPVSWGNESLALTQSIYNELPEDNIIHSGYFKKYIPIVKKRMSQASVRLAFLLDSVLGR